MRPELQGKHLYIDCFAGIAGDMFLGAALDLGVPEATVREALALVPLAGYQLHVGRAERMGIAGCDVKVSVEAADSPAVAAVHHEGHSHDHGHGAHAHDHPGAPHPEQRRGHGHRTWRSIREMLVSAGLPAGVEARALDIFSRIARAEGRLHGQAPEDVAFHEVGAVDSVVDIVGAAVALEALRPSRVTSRRVPLGHGEVRCAHGVLPVPAPASLEILRGFEVEDGGIARELCTPTGAAIIAHSVQSFGQLPPGQVLAAGYGAGDAILAERANHLRLVLLADEPDAAQRDAVVVEANIDNMSPELCGHAMERLFGAGARDVWFTPIVMKKGRPALTLSALCRSADVRVVGDTLLSETTTIGLRFHAVGRRTLERRIHPVETPYGTIGMKVALDGERELNAAPEHEDCLAAARAAGVPLKEVYAAAVAAYRAR